MKQKVIYITNTPESLNLFNKILIEEKWEIGSLQPVAQNMGGYHGGGEIGAFVILIQKETW